MASIVRNVAPALAVAVWCGVCLGQAGGMATTQPGAAGQGVYSSSFADGAGAAWSSNKVEATPKGGRKFLGRFADESVRLSVGDLPAHRLVQVSLDLLVIRTWHGSHPKWGPDVWEAAVVGGPTLLRTTFSNVTFYSGCKQAFPDWTGTAEHAPGTGAARTGTLGYEFTGSPEIGTRVVDSVYRLRFTFPHTGPRLALEFAASGLDDKTGESWGLDNVSVTVLPELNRLDDGQMAALWDALAGEDPVRAYDAAWQLIPAGEAAAQYIGKQLAPVVADPARIASLVGRLGDNDWRARDKASDELADIGHGAVPPLEAALAKASGDGNIEVRLRIEEVLQRIKQQTPGPEFERRYARARHVLRVIHSPTAGKLLENLPARPAPPAKQPESPPNNRPVFLWGG